jgi:hypothetical protein
MKFIPEVGTLQFKVPSQNLSGGTEEDNEKLQSDYPGYKPPRFEPGTFRMLERSVV